MVSFITFMYSHQALLHYFTMWLVACRHYETCAVIDSSRPALKSSFESCAVHSSMSHFPNCTFGNNFYLDEFEDRASLWHWAKRLKQGLLDKDSSPPPPPPPVDLYADTITNLVHPETPHPHPRALRWHSAAVELSTFARVPISTSLQKKKKMPNASHTRGAGTLTNYHSHYHRNRLGLVYENCRCLFKALNSPSHSLSSDWVLLPSSHLFSSATRMEICCTRNPASHSAYYQE